MKANLGHLPLILPSAFLLQHVNDDALLDVEKLDLQGRSENKCSCLSFLAATIQKELHCDDANAKYKFCHLLLQHSSQL